MSKFVISGRLPGINEYTHACRTHKIVGARMKQENQQYVQLEIYRQRKQIGTVKPPIKLIYRFFEPNKKRDQDNVSGFARKVIQDALVVEGVIKNDGWGYVTGRAEEFYIDSENPRIEVEILEAKA